MLNIYYYTTDIGRIGIADNGKAITNVYFEHDPVDDDAAIYETDLLRRAGKQLGEYLCGERKVFTLPLAPHGTDFMQQVWYSLQTIPYGQTQSYAEIAKSIGNEKACRAVGMANNRNPIPIFIPCHRVIGKNGKLIGYRAGLQIKTYLLELEKRYADNFI
ncbi:MAG: methylated-DNA--[protein]-cysteine S-methyltransferase [Syntrophomonadaceae bacterium]|jgi:methylated-DNA-[protein]-cysteine S-methyltransferase